MTNDVQALARRVQVLEDQAALRSLMVRGWRALDHKDFGSWSSCWTEDATFEFGPWGVIRGRAQIRARVQPAEEPYHRMLHHILNMDFQVEGDTATGVGFMWFVGVGPGQENGGQFHLGGPYEWEYRREAGGWRISGMRLAVWYRQGEDSLAAFTG